MDGLIMTAQLILGLSILVVLHELGHFLPAKLFKTKVDKFYLFFDFLFPFPELAKFSLFKIKRGETEYGIGWFPLGGYVKIDGMIDESMDKDLKNRPPKPWEFRAKPTWQRLIIMIGGVTVNLVTGIIIFIAITYFLGEEILPAKEVKYGIVAHPLAQEMGLQTGDKIINVNGVEVQKFSDLYSPDVLLESGSFFTIERNGELKKISIPSNLLDKISDKKNSSKFIDPIFKFEVNRVLEGTPAEKAGLKKGDKIISIDNSDVTFFHQLQSELSVRKGKEVTLKVERERQLIDLKAKVNEEGKLGFEPKPLLNYQTEKFGFGESVIKGTGRAFSIVIVQFKAFKKIFSGDLDFKKSLSGPVGIAREFGGNWDWVRFWNLTGLLSMVLAFMNILPIPALDGGHVIFLLYEMISGRKPSERFLEATQRVGMALLLFLMAFALFNDISKFF